MGDEMTGATGGTASEGGASSSGEDEIETNVKLYKWNLTRSISLSIPFDHFSLLAMLDKNRNAAEVAASILMALLVSICAALIFYEKIYDDFVLVLFCFIVGSCHYSLLKSVQPDSSSPIHGFNRLTPLSRPIYFCMTCLFVVFLRFIVEPKNSWIATYIGGEEISSRIVYFVENFFCAYGYCVRKTHIDMLLGGAQIFLLFLPLVFTLGLFPQISTFTLCVLEQLDMYVFGGTAMANLAGAFLSVARSLIALVVLALILFAATLLPLPLAASTTSTVSISSAGSSSSSSATQLSQTVLFSLYCAFLVVTAYVLSRQTSDLCAYVRLVKDAIIEKKMRHAAKKRSSKLRESKSRDREATESGETETMMRDSSSLQQHQQNQQTNNENSESIQMRVIVKGGSISTGGEQQSQHQRSQSRDYDKINNNNEYISVPDTPLPSPSLSIASGAVGTGPGHAGALVAGGADEDADSSSFISSRMPLRGLKRAAASAGAERATSAAGATSLVAAGGSLLNQPNESESLTLISNYVDTATENKSKVPNSGGARKPSSTTDHDAEANLVKKLVDGSFDGAYEEINNQDPFEARNRRLIRLRLESDVLVCFLTFIIVFALHVSTVFTVLNPILNEIVFALAIAVGVVNHYILPRLRLETPWHTFNQPLLKPSHWSVFEPNYLAKLERFEVAQLILTFAEKNILNVLVIISATTLSCDRLLAKYKPVDTSGLVSCALITLFALKLLRTSFCEPSKQYFLYLVAYLYHNFDAHIVNTTDASETILFDLFVISLLLPKFVDLVEKLEFIYIYTAPWQLPWGSAFHAFAQPLAAPHTSLLILQAVVSSIIGAPLMPLMGSALFLLSYIRPVKFWEKNYNTKRVDNSNTRLQAQFDATTPDNENLNAIFYEHLASVLQQSLCGDLALGRWGNVHGGDFFILSSDYLNCLVHLIEMGNGFVTFQLRGLEFKGTYCQQRELEAITEDSSENDGCCCCKVGHLKCMLSLNASFHLRWVAWSIVSKKYIVNAYRIVDNDLSLIVNFYSLRRTLIDFYIKSAIYYSIRSTKLIDWLTNANIVRELEKFRDNYVDYDTCFDSNLDWDYDSHVKGVTLAKFNWTYSKWIAHCRHQQLTHLKSSSSESSTTATNNNRRKKSTNEQQQQSQQQSSLIYLLEDETSNSLITRFCFALSLVCRRALLTACSGGGGSAVPASSILNNNLNINSAGNGNNPAPSSNTNRFFDTFMLPRPNNNLNNSLNNMGPIGVGSSQGSNGLTMPHMDTDSLSSFQHGYYTLFKGDIRIHSAKDEWVFNDMEILKRIALPAVRMGLRLHQDHFQNESNDEASLYENVTRFDRESVLCYERDPLWRRAVLNNVSSLLSLRHQFTEYSDQYKVVMLSKNFLSFRLIKINKECVRSFWAGQQHELIFLRNKNQERGSIQNAKQVLRNIINSSCDQPIGYPIYVSPLITSYSSTHDQIARVLGPELSFGKIWTFLTNCFQRIRENCTNDCSGSAQNENLYGPVAYSARSDACNFTSVNSLGMGANTTPNNNANRQQQSSMNSSSLLATNDSKQLSQTVTFNVASSSSEIKKKQYQAQTQPQQQPQQRKPDFSKQHSHDSSNSRFFV